MFRTYAFSGRKNEVLAVLSIAFLGLVGVIIWVTSKTLTCLSRRPILSKRIPDSSMGPQCHSCSYLLYATAVSPFRINQPWMSSWQPLHQTRHRSPFPITWECVYDSVCYACLLTCDLFFAQLISVRCHFSYIATLAETALLDPHNRFRLPQRVHSNLGECDDRYLLRVHVSDDHSKPYSTAFGVVPSVHWARVS